ncbi:hypothetical protein [Aliiroseovarius sp. F20344]|uniref:hypothetical protein n=1 Tax=Aliiroseovarius sp. F20344 TaxID=2926414 RepID=UPI001FF3719F|nr:hypothetical protein [Aliiroseovarius sp. F20344]MCK0143942.1 hypothetical protein [Aliiroseovarius sp. F20344]
MLKITLRYLPSIMVAGTLLVLFFLFSFSDRDEYNKFSTCKNETSAQCITDLGLDRVASARSLPPHMREVDMLAQMDRIEDAFALELRILSEKERPPKNIEASANRRLASHRIAAQIRKGNSLETAIDQTPSTDAGVLWISALDLLGRKPYGPLISPTLKPDKRTLEIVSEIAERIARFATEETERARISHLIYAAELYAALGNQTRVIELLGNLPQAKNPHINLSEDLLRLIGPQEGMHLYHKAGGNRPHILLTAASAETDLIRAADYLERAFNEYSTADRRPDLDRMERIVSLAADLGLEEFALRLARAVADQAQTAPSNFPVFPHLNAVRALMAAGADESETRESLVRAEEDFPQNDQEYLGVGLVSGAIFWGSSGLKAQARREFATLSARQGGVDATIQMMDDIEQPVFAWNDMLTHEIPLEALDELFNAASAVLTREELAYVKAQHAQDLLLSGGAEEQLSWVKETTKDVLRGEQLVGDRSVTTYSTLTRIAARLGDQDNLKLALRRMADAALGSREPSDLITAGFYWYQADNIR